MLIETKKRPHPTIGHCSNIQTAAAATVVHKIYHVCSASYSGPNREHKCTLNSAAYCYQSTNRVAVDPYISVQDKTGNGEPASECLKLSCFTSACYVTRLCCSSEQRKLSEQPLSFLPTRQYNRKTPFHKAIIRSAAFTYQFLARFLHTAHSHHAANCSAVQALRLDKRQGLRFLKLYC